MHTLTAVNSASEALMDRDWPRIYDGQDPSQAEAGDLALMELYGPAALYEQVAATLRRRIYAGEYAVGQALPSEEKLAAEFRRSRPLVNRALGKLVDEDLVSAEQGRGTFVLPRRLYRAEVGGICWTRDDVIAEEAFTAVADAVAAAEEADPAVADADLTGSGPRLAVAMDVEAANPARAGDIAWAIAEGACRDGWDLSAASVEARPADGDLLPQGRRNER